MKRFAAQLARQGKHPSRQAASGIGTTRLPGIMFRVCSALSNKSRIFPATMLLSLACSGIAGAKVTAPVRVGYETENGRSNLMKVNADFMTGTELNQATHSLRFDGLRSYVVIFWSNSEATIIHIDDLVLCSGEFDLSCLPMTRRLAGTDQNSRQWTICTTSSCF